MATYTHENFERIAAAIGTEVEEIANHAKLVDAAARWYRLDRNRSNLPLQPVYAGSSIKSQKGLASC